MTDENTTQPQDDYERRLREEILAGNRIPYHMRDGIVDYIMDGRETGGFLRAVFCNQFVQSFQRADVANLKVLDRYVRLLMDVPSPCQGSEREYEEWIKVGGLRGSRVRQ